MHNTVRKRAAVPAPVLQQRKDSGTAGRQALQCALINLYSTKLCMQAHRALAQMSAVLCKYISRCGTALLVASATG